ncbi:MAG: ImmA/IrrE family metallo-endopeptidase [Gemmatimonadales bacterium]
MLRFVSAGALCLTLLACGERGEAQSERRVLATAEELLPKVERAVGLPFKQPPRIAVRSREQVSRYLVRKLDDEMPPDMLHGIATAYRLFGLIPDTLDLYSLLLALYTEQVVGYFDPDSATLYVVAGSDPMQLRMVLAHELVHALQAQYVSIDELLDPGRTNDRRTAAQAVLEGQATLASLTALMPDQDFDAMPEFWNTYRFALTQQHELMPVFSSAPLIIREVLIFPYLGGADFVRWFNREYPDTVPFGARLPVSTEQILHPDRYGEGDLPIELAVGDGSPVLYSDGLGEFEIRVLLTQLTGSESVGRAGALAWGGDRYAVVPTGGDEYALVWWSVWDTERAADRFSILLSRLWPDRRAAGRRHVIERLTVERLPAVRLIDAPVGWEGWQLPPGVRVVTDGSQGISREIP